MSYQRGEIWLAELDPTRGSEQAGKRPVLVFQNDAINAHSRTVVCIPLTANLKRSALPSCVLLSRGEGGLNQDSVALCHQLRVLDKSRLVHRLGSVSPMVLAAIETCCLYTLGIASTP